MKLVLFDIDGTLLRTDGAGRRSMERALLTVFGTTGSPDYRYDGKTDRQITREQMRAAGFTDATIDARMDDVFDVYIAQLTRELETNPAQAERLAGVPLLLETLRVHDGVTLGLLTGNIEPGAQRKLAAVDIAWDQFRANAFGSDHEERSALPAVAQQRANTLLGRNIDGSQLVIIGDTPADIQCGRSLGVRAIGVATGRFSTQDLAQHAPFAVLESLADTDAALDAILA
jgi:phosphoglycolate phosphatase-like HAD superfamily hydrolase